MAAVVVILGSFFGLAVGLIGWLAFDLSFPGALAIWIGAGPASAMIAMMLRQSGTAPAPDASMAEV